MHGVIHRTLKQYVEQRMSDGAWERVRDHAGVEPKLYLPVSHYDDEEFTAMVGAIADLSGHDETTIREDFGQYLAPELLDTFRAHVRDEWGALDLLEHLDEVYADVERQNEESSPPDVDCDRVVSDMVVLTYRSDRDLCDMGRGLLRGVADVYGDDLAITEEKCTREGDSHCEFTIERGGDDGGEAGDDVAGGTGE